MRRTRAERSFHIDAWVVVPDHIRCILTLPPGDADFSNRIKSRGVGSRSNSPLSRWYAWWVALRFEPTLPCRFREHAIRDDRDYAHHMDYVHFNPVKHGLAAT